MCKIPHCTIFRPPPPAGYGDDDEPKITPTVRNYSKFASPAEFKVPRPKSNFTENNNNNNVKEENNRIKLFEAELAAGKARLKSTPSTSSSPSEASTPPTLTSTNGVSPPPAPPPIPPAPKMFQVVESKMSSTGMKIPTKSGGPPAVAPKPHQVISSRDALMNAIRGAGGLQSLRKVRIESSKLRLKEGNLTCQLFPPRPTLARTFKKKKSENGSRARILKQAITTTSSLNTVRVGP